MKGFKKASLMILSAALILIFSCPLLAEERNIYIGDLIELKITTHEFTEDEIREKFNDFEIVELKSIPDGYLVTLRTFETGEKVVDLGGNEIIITVKSTLDEIDRDEVFEGSLTPESAGFMPNFNYLFFAAVIVFAASGGVLAARYVKKRRDLRLTPYERFIKQLDRISVDDADCLVKLTMCFKEYLEAKFLLRIKGKTSTEMTGEISTVNKLQPFINRISNWLNESDYYKFSCDIASKDENHKLLAGLKEIVSQIEQADEEKA